MQVIVHNLKQLLVALDQFLNVLVCTVILPWERSYADETFSSRCWRWYLAGVEWPRIVVDTLLFFDKNHCQESFESERLGRQLPPEARP